MTTTRHSPPQVRRGDSIVLPDIVDPSLSGSITNYYSINTTTLPIYITTTKTTTTATTTTTNIQQLLHHRVQPTKLLFRSNIMLLTFPFSSAQSWPRQVSVGFYRHDRQHLWLHCQVASQSDQCGSAVHLTHLPVQAIIAIIKQ